MCKHSENAPTAVYLHKIQIPQRQEEESKCGVRVACIWFYSAYKNGGLHRTLHRNLNRWVALPRSLRWRFVWHFRVVVRARSATYVPVATL